GGDGQHLLEQLRAARCERGGAAVDEDLLRAGLRERDRDRLVVRHEVREQHRLVVEQAARALDLERARGLLDDKTMLLAYFMTNDQAVAIALTKTGAKQVLVDGGPAALAARSAQLLEEVLAVPA